MDDGSGMSEVLATATQNAAETGLDICCRQAHGEDVNPEPVRLCHIPASSRDNAHRTNVDQTRAFSETLSLYSYTLMDTRSIYGTVNSTTAYVRMANSPQQDVTEEMEREATEAQRWPACEDRVRRGISLTLLLDLAWRRCPDVG